MKVLLILGILFSFNSFAKINYTCSKDKWNQAKFQGNMFLAEIQVSCQTSLDATAMDRIEAAMVRRYQEASDVVQVHEVGEKEMDGMIGTYILSNLKQSIPKRGEMNIKFNSFVGIGANSKIYVKSNSLNIKATGYSRYTKKIILRRIISVVNGKIIFMFREFDKIEKPKIAPKGIFVRAAKKGLSDNMKRKIPWLLNYLEQNI